MDRGGSFTIALPLSPRMMDTYIRDLYRVQADVAQRPAIARSYYLPPRKWGDVDHVALAHGPRGAA